MRFQHIERAIGVEVSQGQPHARLYLPIFVHRQTQLKPPFAKRTVPLVLEKQAGGRIGSHIDVRPAGSEIVGSHRGQPESWFRAVDSRGVGHVAESTITIVAIEQAPLGLQATWPAINWNAFKAAIGIPPGSRDRLKIEHHVVGDKQVQQAVAIIVHPRATRSPAPALVKQPGLPRHIRKRAIPVVPVEHVLAPLGNEDVIEPVVVVIADASPRKPSPDASDPAFSVTSVNVPSRLFWYSRFVAPATGPLAAGARKNKHIQPAIVVVIEKCDPTTHGFQDVIRPSLGPVNYWRVQARLRGYIGKSRVKGEAGGLPSRLSPRPREAIPACCALTPGAAEARSHSMSRRVTNYSAPSGAGLASWSHGASRIVISTAQVVTAPVSESRQSPRNLSVGIWA